MSAAPFAPAEKAEDILSADIPSVSKPSWKVRLETAMEQSGSADASFDKADNAVKAEKPNAFRQKIMEAQKAQADSRKRENPPAAAGEKSVPVDAENIIHLPVADYAEEEERLATETRNRDLHSVSTLDLFPDRAFSEESEEIDWQAFMEYCAENGFPSEYVPLIQGLSVALTKEHCFIKIPSGPQVAIFGKIKNQLENLLCTFLQRNVKIQTSIVAYEFASDEELREKAMSNPQILQLINEFGAEIYRCYGIKHGRKN